MKNLMNKLLGATAAALAVLLAGCGGASDAPDQVLSIDDGAPAAYTSAYLDQNPQLLLQPEHLITAELRGNKPVQVRLHIREPMTLSIALDENRPLLSRVAIVDAAGTEVLHHRPGNPVLTATLAQGNHTIVFTPDAQAVADGLLHRVYLKLADKPSQAKRLGMGMKRAAVAPGEAPPHTTGVVLTDSCPNCDFSFTDLSNEDFSGQDLQGSEFVGTRLFATQFVGTNCSACVFYGLNLAGSQGEATNFSDANLQAVVFLVAGDGVINMTLFNGANMAGAWLDAIFMNCDFRKSIRTQHRTNLAGATLSYANFSNSQLGGADFSNAQVASTTFQPGSGFWNKFQGATFDNIQPNNIFSGANFKGYDLTGTSFVGVDLSASDLSGATNVYQANIKDAILSNGSTGVNLSGVDFGTKYAGFAGSMLQSGSGKDLRGVNLSGANLYEADLTQVLLNGANLQGATLSFANLYGADLRGAQIGAAQGSAISPGSLNGAYMPLANLADADLRSVNFNGAHIYGLGTSFARAQLASANFSDAYLQEADFTSANLSDAVFSNASLVNANFNNSTLNSTKFSDARLQGTDFGMAAVVIGVQLDNAAVADVAGVFKDFQEQNSDKLVYAYNATVLGVLASSKIQGAVCPNGQPAPCNTPNSLTPLRAGPYPSAVPGCNPVYKDTDYPSCHYCNCLRPTPK